MDNALDPLVLDFVEWVAKAPRPYADVLDAWRTSCPRLTVWEDAVDRGFVVRRSTGQGTQIEVTPSGGRFLTEHGRGQDAVLVSFAASVSHRPLRRTR